MNYAQQQKDPARNLGGIAAVILFHIALIWAIASGLGNRIVEVVAGPMETKIVKEVTPPPPDAPPLLPPKFTPPPAFIPPVDINVAQSTAPTNAIVAVTTTPPPAPVATPPPAPAAAPAAPPKPPVVKKTGCREPEYPASSARLGESGTVVLQLLVGVDGKVTDAKVTKSSGFPRLDEAAKAALSLCKFDPGSQDGKPVPAWAPLAYKFVNPNQ